MENPTEGAPAPTLSAAPESGSRAFVPLSIDPNSPRPSFYSDDGDVDERWAESPPPVDLQLQTSSTHHDPHLRLRLLFTLMGMGMLFPYNVVITCVDYFEALHPEERDVAGRLAASTITALLITTAGLMVVSSPGSGSSSDGAGASARGGGRAALGGCLSSPVRRIFLGYSLCFVLLLSVPLLPARPSMNALVALAFAVGAADATSQSGLYVLAASFGVPSYSAALVFGSAAAGLAVSALRLGTRAAFDSTTLEGLARGADALFVISAGIMACCIGALVVTVRNGGGRGRVDGEDGRGEAEVAACGELELRGEGNLEQHARQPSHHKSDSAPANEHSPVLAEKTSRLNRKGTRRKSGQKWHAVTEYSHGIVEDSFSDEDAERESGMDALEGTPQASSPQQRDGHGAKAHNGVSLGRRWTLCDRFSHHPRFEVYLRTLPVVWKPTLAAFLNFFVTLSLFPGTIASIVSSPQATGIRFGSALPIVLITTFNAADCAGRAVLNVERLGLARMLLSSPSSPPQSGGDTAASASATDVGTQTPERGALLPNFDVLAWRHALTRLVFYPLIAACVLPAPSHALVSSDLLRVLIVFLFGFSNGFVNCACFVAAPAMTPASDGPGRDAASLLVLLAVYGGLMGGAYFGLAVDKLLGMASEGDRDGGDS